MSGAPRSETRKKSVGTVFCGGCNPLFDREKLFRDLRALLADRADLRYREEGAAYDLLIVIRGCLSECVAIDDGGVPAVVLSSACLREAEARLRPYFPESAFPESALPESALPEPAREG